MELIQLILVLVCVGIMLWAIDTYLPMDATIKRILNIVVIAVTALWCLRVLGVLEALRIPVQN